MAGVRILSSTRQERRSGIVNFKSERMTSTRIHGALMQQNIQCVTRGDGVRLSPHFYQGEEETAHVLDAIESLLKKG